MCDLIAMGVPALIGATCLSAIALYDALANYMSKSVASRSGRKLLRLAALALPIGVGALVSATAWLPQPVVWAVLLPIATVGVLAAMGMLANNMIALARRRPMPNWQPRVIGALLLPGAVLDVLAFVVGSFCGGGVR